MTENKIDLTTLDTELSAAEATKNIDTLKKNTTGMCPVCGLSRMKGDHKKCSKITQMKYQKGRG
jgi:hypothetical protein